MSSGSDAVYWESRARQFAAEGEGLAAVCSYGMPWFYNRSIALCQARALRRWLRRPFTQPSDARPRALDVGCGVGRWSVQLAGCGYDVTGIDISPYMIERARSRAQAARASCTFSVGDIRALDLGSKFDLILCVTVLQHVREAEEARSALAKLAAHLAPGGILVALEAAPSSGSARCNTPIFTARSFAWYCEALRAAGLTLEAIGGVDPAPCKTWLLPYYRSLPRALALSTLAAATLISLPIDWMLGPLLPHRSWHKVLMARRAAGSVA